MMKIKFITKRKIISIMAICIAAALTALICIPTLTVLADYSGQDNSLTREQLHSLTSATYVNNDTPAITVFMHGLGANAGAWGNNFSGKNKSGLEFAYDKDSIIEQMRDNAISGIQLFRAKTKGVNSFSLYSEYNDNESPEVHAIPDFSKHTIIVMDMNNTYYTAMEDLYEQLHYVIDTISYDYFCEMGSLPRINLIGHSLGGLINMQYTIEHPKNVAALVSFGTPYNGSWYENPIVELFGIKEFQQQPCITCKCGHHYYFCNLETRRNTWNNVYAQNPHIKFFTFSGETDKGVIDHIVNNNHYIEDYCGISEYAADFLRELYDSIDLLTLFLPGDICVDTDSQKAVGYDGAINYNKRFYVTNSNFDKRSMDHLPVPHNLEPYDADMQNCLLQIIDYGYTKPLASTYTNNGITTSIVAKSGSNWLIKLINNTGSARSFEYNQKMCFEADARSWTGLGDISCTDVLANGQSTILEIQENGTASDITISYENGNSRYISYAHNLDSSSRTMKSLGSSKTCYSFSQNNMKVSIMSLCGDVWMIKLTNNTGSRRRFYYNQKMCFDNDAKNWSGLTNVMPSVEIANGA